jgi:hypothetical protein
VTGLQVGFTSRWLTRTGAGCRTTQTRIWPDSCLARRTLISSASQTASGTHRYESGSSWHADVVLWLWLLLELAGMCCRLWIRTTHTTLSRHRRSSIHSEDSGGRGFLDWDPSCQPIMWCRLSPTSCLQTTHQRSCHLSSILASSSMRQAIAAAAAVVVAIVVMVVVKGMSWSQDTGTTATLMLLLSLNILFFDVHSPNSHLHDCLLRLSHSAMQAGMSPSGVRQHRHPMPCCTPQRVRGQGKLLCCAVLCCAVLCWWYHCEAFWLIGGVGGCALKVDLSICWLACVVQSARLSSVCAH